MNRKGITLIEVVVALSLSALMLVALNGVLSGLLRQKQRATVVHHREWAYELDRMFWNDLAQARGVSFDKGALVMMIPAAIHVPNGTASDPNKTGTIQSVVYQLVPTNKDQSRLIRSVFSGLGDAGGPLLTQTLLWNVQRATFERVDDAGNSQPLPRDLGPTPRAFRYQLWMDNDPTPRFNQILVR